MEERRRIAASLPSGSREQRAQEDGDEDDEDDDDDDDNLDEAEALAEFDFLVSERSEEDSRTDGNGM